MKKYTACSLTLILLGTSAGAGGQNANTSVMEQRQAASTASVKPAEPKISAEDRERATKLLDLSESQARSFEAPLRSYVLYQVAQSYLPLDKAKSRGLYRDAFTSTLEIRDDDDLKQRLQDSILTGMLGVSQPDVEELMQQAEPPARKRASIAIANKYLAAKKFDRAVALVQSMTSWTEFPYDIGSQIMSALPEQMNGDFRGLFTQAFSSYQNYPHKQIQLGGGDFGAMVAKFGMRLPARMTLDAIDEVLKQSKKRDNASISVGGDAGTASFSSFYDFELFQLMPLLRKLDEGHAKKLLEDNQAVNSFAQQFPNGVQSLAPEQPDPVRGGTPDTNKADANKDAPTRGPGTSFTVSSGDKAQGASAEGNALMELGRRAEQIARDSEKDPQQAIAEALSLPSTKGFSPRARALGGIAQANVKKNPQAAKQALDELRKTIPDLVVPREQIRPLATAARLYLQINETDAAEQTVSDGFKLSKELLVSDDDAEDPNKALKAFWPSVDCYRQFLEIETKISQKDAEKLLAEIQDPEMQTIERVMFINALLGKPMRVSVVSQKKKNDNYMMMTSSD